MLAEKVALRFRFHSLSNDSQLEHVANIDDRLCQGFRHCVAPDSLHKAFVDLQFLDGKPVEVVQRGVAGAKVVNRKPYSEVIYRIERRANVLDRLVKHDSFGHFEDQVLRRQAMGLQGLRNKAG